MLGFPKVARSGRKPRRGLLVELLEPRLALAATFLDPDFGDHGYLAIDPSVVEETHFGWDPIDADLHVLPNGKLLIVSQYRLAQFFGDGALDPTFGNLGAIDSDVVGPPNIRAVSRVLSDGKIIYIQDGSIIHRFLPDGTRDNRFSEDAIAIFTDFPTELVSRQGDGMVAAYSGSGSVTLAGLKDDGSTDPSFGESGFSSINRLGSVYGMLSRADGKILVGSAAGDNTNLTLVQFNVDGSLDHTFGVDGVAETPVTVSWDLTVSILERPDGSLVVAGGIGDAPLAGSSVPSRKIQLAAFHADGSPIDEFGSNGVVNTHLQFPEMEYGRDNYVAVDEAGRVFVVGEATGRIRLQRYLTDGSLDEAFSTAATADLQSHITAVPAIAVSNSGDVFLLKRDASAILKFKGDLNAVDCSAAPTEEIAAETAGEFSDGATWYLPPGAEKVVATPVAGRFFTLAAPPRLGEVEIGTGCHSIRYRAPDSIGVRDQFTIAVQDHSFEERITIQVVVGLEVHDDDFVIEPDPEVVLDVLANDTFVPGYLGPQKITSLNAGDSAARISVDGRQILFSPRPTAGCGEEHYQLEYTVDGATSARIQVATRNTCPLPTETDGYLDSGFGQQGYAAVGGIPGAIYPPSDANMHVLTDGKLLVVSQYYLVRLLGNGEPDPTFGDQGLKFTGVVGPPNAALTSQLLPDGKIFLLQDGVVLYRFLTDGTPDSHFRPQSFVPASIGWRFISTVFAQAEDGDYAVAYIASDEQDSNKKTLYILRVNADGSLDNGWGESGTAMIPWANDAEASSLTWLPDGKLLLATENFRIVKGWDVRDLVLTQFNPDGTLDTSFGDEGMLATSLTGRRVTVAVVPRHDGTIIVSGADAEESTNTIRFAAFNADGSVLQRFGDNGRLDTGLSVLEDNYPLDDYLAIDGTDRIVVVGQSRSGALNLLRILPDGSLDQEFSEGATVELQGHMTELPTLDVSESGDVFLLRRDASGVLKIKSDPETNEPAPPTCGCKKDDDEETQPVPIQEATPPTSQVERAEAVDDRVHTVSPEAVQIDVLANDILPGNASDARIRLLAATSRNDARLEIAGDGRSVIYTPTKSPLEPEVTFSIIDAFEYELEFNGDTSRNDVVVDVEFPWNWHKSELPQDVDGDGVLLPEDALRVINLLNQLEAGRVTELDGRIKSAVDDYRMFLAVADFVGSPPEYNGPRRSHADVDNDGFVAPIDALMVINAVNANFASATVPEGEGAPETTLPVFQPGANQALALRAAGMFPFSRESREEFVQLPNPLSHQMAELARDEGPAPEQRTSSNDPTADIQLPLARPIVRERSRTPLLSDLVFQNEQELDALFVSYWSHAD